MGEESEVLELAALAPSATKQLFRTSRFDPDFAVHELHAIYSELDLMREPAHAVGSPSVPKSDGVVVIAHPDDEIFVSGTLCLLAEKGFRITLISVTDGENGSRELLRHVVPEVPLGAVRRRELALSAWALGIAEVAYLGREDISSRPVGKGKRFGPGAPCCHSG